MEKLRNKVFLVILGILTIFLVSILFIFNFQDYIQEENNIKNNLTRMSGNRDKIDEKFDNMLNEKMDDKINDKINNKLNDKTEEKIDDQIYEIPLEFNEDRNGITVPKIFMDNVVYVVTLDENYEILEVTNHSQDSTITDEKIKEIAQDIIDNNKREIEHIGNLYFDEYSYSFRTDKTIVIIDNTQARNRLIITLKDSLLIFLMLEAIIIYVASKLTQWIIKPVKASFDKQKQFIADASHELKTPLAVIIASSEALEKEPNEKKWLNNIKEESDRMSNLISDLLDLARLENSEKQQYENQDLSKLIERSLLTFESLIYEKNIKLEYKIGENINFTCNSNQIKQLVGILLDNAIKYTSKGGEINFSLQKDKNNIILNVKNTGKEIPKEEQEKIFERFYRVDEARSRGENSYGLGLAIAKNIVEKHNGKISVNSSNGYNSFIITFKQV